MAGWLISMGKSYENQDDNVWGTPPMTSETSRCGGLRNPALISCENAGFCDLPQYDGFKPMPKMTGGRTGAKKNCDKNGTNWCQGLTYGMPWQEKIPV